MNIRHMTIPLPTEIVGTEALRLVLVELTGQSMSRSTVDRLVRDGHLKPFRRMPGKNGAYLFKRAEVDRYVRHQKAAA